MLLFLLYVYACLYGYPLLDNHFTTAWFMTGQYTAQLLESILNLIAGIFRMEFSWNDTAAWYAVSACLLVYPFVLLGTFLGDRNFWPVFIASLLPPVAWLTGHWMLWSGALQMGLGAVTALLSASFLAFFTDEERLGREKKEGRAPLIRIKVDNKKRILFGVLCAAAWGVTVWAGRIRSFGAVMRLIFSSSVYSYQKNLYSLADMRIAQAMLVSYVTSLVVKFVLSLVEFEDDSRFSKVLTPAWMLLFQIWVLPLLSNFMSRAAESAQGTFSGEEIGDAMDGISWRRCRRDSPFPGSPEDSASSWRHTFCSCLRCGCPLCGSACGSWCGFPHVPISIVWQVFFTGAPSETWRCS